MNITHEKTDGQLELIKLEIIEADYKDNVQKSLKKLQKSIDMPGFRKGNVPFGMVDKMYGKAVKSEEVDKLISQTVGGYFSENEARLLGSPLPNAEKNSTIDWDNQTDFTVYFDVALVPEFDLDLAKLKATKYTIVADEKLINDSIQNIANQYGKIDSVETTTEGSMLYGEFVELNADGTPKEGGIKVSSSFLTKMLHTDEAKALFVGKNNGDVVDFDFRKAFDNVTEITSMLKVSREVAESLNSKMRFTINFSYDVKPHELNEELFEKAFPGENVKTEEVFRTKVKENLENTYKRETEKVFLTTVQKELVENTKMDLPKEFLIRWFAQRSEGKENEAQIESQWDISYEKSVKWQLIEKKLSQTENITVSKEELAAFIKSNLPSYFLDMNPDETEEEKEKRIDSLVQSVIADEKNVMRFYETLFDKKIMDVFTAKMKVTEKNVTFDEFMTILNDLK